MLQYQARRCRLGLAQCLIWIVFPVTGPTPARRSRVSLWLRLCCATALAWHVPAHTARADDTIFINEVLPDYVNGPGNWIELHNTSATAAVSLDFWQLDTGGDANAGVYYIGPDTTIPAGGYLVFERSATSLSLAKSGTVRLLNLEGTVVDQVNYVVTEDGASIARVPNGSATWMEVSEPTKGAANAASTSALAPTPTPTPTPAPSPIPTPTHANTPRQHPRQRLLQLPRLPRRPRPLRLPRQYLRQRPLLLPRPLQLPHPHLHLLQHRPLHRPPRKRQQPPLQLFRPYHARAIRQVRWSSMNWPCCPRAKRLDGLNFLILVTKPLT